MITDGEPDIRAGDLGGLSEQECRRLLSTRTLGRVGLTSGALPVIMPVEYVYEAGVITFRTAHDAKLRAAEQGDVLAFEVDAYDAASGHGWSVHVLGRATVQADDCDVAPLLRSTSNATADTTTRRPCSLATMCDCTARS